MTTVARTIRSSPYRDTVKTWEVIIDLLTKGLNGEARAELLSVAGIAAAMIAERGPRDAAIVVSGDCPRTRIYCLYDEDALDGSDATEDALGYEPLVGDWAISLPCPKDDLGWVQAALSETSRRVTARDMSKSLGAVQGSNSRAVEELVLQPGVFFKQ